MSTFPKDRHELLRARYVAPERASVCKGCNAPIEWWKTTNGKSMPFNPMPDDRSPAVTHFSTCPRSKEFKATSSSAPDAPPAGKYDWNAEAKSLRSRAKARVVVIVDEDRTYVAYRDGIPGEDLRHDLIAAGNHIRETILKGDTTR
jgi:hypothetical protein